MSRGGDSVRSMFQFWLNSSLGAGMEKGDIATFSYILAHPAGSWAAQERRHHRVNVIQPISVKELKAAVLNFGGA